MAENETQMQDRRATGETNAPNDDPLLQFFSYTHLPPSLADVSRPFCDLAFHMVATMRRNPERTVCLRKLLEAKDCAVRSLLMK